MSLSGSEVRMELTLRGLIIGVVITAVFTAANVYFGLKAGITFSTSIPAAVIAMALLRLARGATIQENNVVQTIASAAGTLSSIIFVLPGFIIIGWWTGFPFWLSFAVCAFGGVLGVMYSIPLRRALVTNSDLPYPEGIACAEVLRAGMAAGSGAAESQAGVLAVLWGSIVSAVFAVVVATQVFASDVVKHLRLGERGAVTGFDLSLSFALFGIGHLVGLSVGLAMFIGALIGWGWGVPHYSQLMPHAAGSIATLAHDAWSQKVRYVGAGAIAVSAVWTLAKMVQPVLGGLRSALVSSRARKAGQGALLPRTEQDIPIGIVGLVTLLCLLPVGLLLGGFGASAGFAQYAVALGVAGAFFVALMGFFVSTVCGYMAGLIGSSNSPLSGVGIIVVIAAALLLVVGIKPLVAPELGRALVAFALFTTAVVFTVAAIANNNLQDLKTGQLVDATPWKQQVALLIGVVAGSAVIPPVLDLVNHAYGFAGAPGAGAGALPAPQAGLISALARGVITQDIDWSLIVTGAAIGAAIIAVDEVLRITTGRLRVPPLAVGLGIYLPTASTLMVTVGAVAGWIFDRFAQRAPKPEATQQLGVLLASGLIVGESIIGVIVTALVAFADQLGFKNHEAPLALVGPGFADAAQVLGFLVFAATAFLLYLWISRQNRGASSRPKDGPYDESAAA